MSQPPISAPYPEKPFAFAIRSAPSIKDLKLLDRRQPEAMGREPASESKRWMQIPVLPLTSSVNLGKEIVFFEIQFPLLPMEIVTALSTIQGCWQGQRGE